VVLVRGRFLFVLAHVVNRLPSVWWKIANFKFSLGFGLQNIRLSFHEEVVLFLFDADPAARVKESSEYCKHSFEPFGLSTTTRTPPMWLSRQANAMMSLNCGIFGLVMHFL
jgi:hypothetical protein